MVLEGVSAWWYTAQRNPQTITSLCSGIQVPNFQRFAPGATKVEYKPTLRLVRLLNAHRKNCIFDASIKALEL